MTYPDQRSLEIAGTSFHDAQGGLTESIHCEANEVIKKRHITSLILKRNTIADDSLSWELQQVIHSRLEGKGRIS
jgi:hypothetical protein